MNQVDIPSCQEVFVISAPHTRTTAPRSLPTAARPAACVEFRSPASACASPSPFPLPAFVSAFRVGRRRTALNRVAVRPHARYIEKVRVGSQCPTSS